MTVEPQPPIRGRLVLYRVLELSRGFSDRGDGMRSYRTDTNSEGYGIEITLGTVPESLVIDLRYAVPIMSAAPAARAAMSHDKVDEPEHPDEPYDLTPPDFVDPVATYLTVACTTDAAFVAIPDRTVFWVADCESALAQLNEHRDKAQPVLDRVCARLLGKGIDASKVIRTPGALFEPDDEHQPFVVSTLEMSATVRSDSAGWAEYDMSTLEHLADDVWDVNANDRVLVNPAWWYYQAMNENDPLRRFLFAHWGLEALAAQFCKHHQTTVARDLTSTSGLPATSLFWPTPDGSDRPTRNIQFQFALMAWALKGSGCERDIVEFKRLAVLRNKVSHGKRIDHKALPRHDGYLMLRDYLRLAANYDTSATAPQ